MVMVSGHLDECIHDWGGGELLCQLDISVYGSAWRSVCKAELTFNVFSANTPVMRPRAITHSCVHHSKLLGLSDDSIAACLVAWSYHSTVDSHMIGVVVNCFVSLLYLFMVQLAGLSIRQNSRLMYCQQTYLSCAHVLLRTPAFITSNCLTHLTYDPRYEIKS